MHAASIEMVGKIRKGTYTGYEIPRESSGIKRKLTVNHKPNMR